MTPDQMASLHADAFRPARGWTSAEFETLCEATNVCVVTRPGGIALVRSVADEAELLTLAVAPGHRRQGIADALMIEWMTGVSAQKAFLEVAANNNAALALYRKHGFTVSGCRKAYYARKNGPAMDAIVMQVALTSAQSGESER